MKTLNFLLWLLTLPLLLPAQCEDFEMLGPSYCNPKFYTVRLDTLERQLTESYWRADGTRFNWQKVYQLDAAGNIIREATMDTLGGFKEGVICSAPLIKIAYDQSQNPVEISYWKNDQTKANHDCQHFHRETRIYDQRQRMLEHSFYYRNGKMTNRIRYAYDKNGNRKRVTYLDKNNRPIPGNKSIVLVKYDAQNREIKRSYRSQDNKKVKTPGTVSYVVTEYFADHRIETQYDAQKQVLRKERISGNGAVSIKEAIKN